MSAEPDPLDAILAEIAEAAWRLMAFCAASGDLTSPAAKLAASASAAVADYLAAAAEAAEPPPVRPDD